MTLKKIKFNVDMIYDGNVLYEAGKVYEVPVETGSFQRWLKRGAEEVLDNQEVKEDSKEDAVKIAEKPVVKPGNNRRGNSNKDKIDL